MFKAMVLCSVAAGLAISLAACGKSDEDKCKDLLMTQFPEGKVPEHLKDQFDQGIKACAAGAKLVK